MTDEFILLQQAKEGDHEAFQELRQTLYPMIHRFVSRLIGHREDTEDIMQNVFIALYANIEDIDPPKKLRPFLFRVARNQCYDVLRHRKYRQTMDYNDDLSELLPSRDISPEESTHWRILYEQVKLAIDRLPQAQREVLILYAEERLGYEEIAEVVHTNVGTVKSRLHYAKRTLRGMLDTTLLEAMGIIPSAESILKSRLNGDR